MTKYKVKNCPAYIINGQCAMNGEHDSPFEPVPCKDRTDCPIKQVVKIYAQECPIKEIMNADDNEMFEAGRLAKRVLQTLQVEEVE